MLRALSFLLTISLAQTASAQMVITEWMYNGAGTSNTGEFVEFTNVGASSVDMTGWSFDDDSRVAGTVSLSAFGVVAPGQSVILTDETAADFATIWGVSDVVIIGGNTTNLGRNDEINLFDATGAVADRLAYGDETYPGTVRPQSRSCNIPPSDYGYEVIQGTWVLATDGDAYGSSVSTRGEVASPGRIVAYAWNDFDQDGDVDLDDFDVFACQLAGPSIAYTPTPPACGLYTDNEGRVAADADGDGDVDLADFAELQVSYGGGSDTPPGPTQIILNGASITVIGSGVTVSGTQATITAEGTYEITGTLTDGQIVVNSVDAGIVELDLNGTSISNSTTAPLYIISAASTSIVLGEGTTNYLSDAATYVYPDPAVDEPNAALFSKDSLLISGAGTLTVHGNYNDAITSKDELVITSGTFDVTSVDDGIRGKDYLLIQGGTFTLTTGGDALKSDNTDDVTLGYITIADGSFDITSGGDGIAAESTATITGGDLEITSGGGHTATLPADASAKGVKGVGSVVIEGGTFTLDCADDGVHSNGPVTIGGAGLTIATADDAVHSDTTLHVISGTFTITTCFEGLEGASIAIDDGTFHITSSDDAITADTTVTIANGSYTILTAGGHTVTIPSDSSAKGVKGLTVVTINGGTFNIDAADDGIHTNGTINISGGTFTIAVNSSTSPSAGYGDGVHADTALNITGGDFTINPCYEGIESPHITVGGGTIRITSTDDGVNAAGASGASNWLHITGGYIAVNAQGDGIDVNGSITMSAGTVIVHGPTRDDNGAIDYDTTFNISGGFLLAAGSAGMAQAPSASSSQRSVKITYGSAKTAGTLAHIETNASPHTSLFTFAPVKTYRSLVFSAPTLTASTAFDLYRGGTCTGTATDGLYSGGTYSGGTRTSTFTTTGVVTSVSAP